MLKHPNRKYGVMIGEAVLRMIIYAIDHTYANRFVNRETGKALTGIEMFADCLLELVQYDALRFEIYSRKGGKLVPSYPVLFWQDRDYDSWEEARAEVVAELLKGGSLYCTMVPSDEYELVTKNATSESDEKEAAGE